MLQLAKPFSIFSKSTIWMLSAKLVTHMNTNFLLNRPLFVKV